MFQPEHSAMFQSERNDDMFRLEHYDVMFQSEHCGTVFQPEHSARFPKSIGCSGSEHSNVPLACRKTRLSVPAGTLDTFCT